ncbi:hypothetical protein C2E21_5126 [Chlorella sorokiniana]|uniref:Uncharacterized protein n=1 Tax=Chlorella sorokiniana TaxID=3076 RepID=A0A2P6TQJ9_CHLSO|nr:hypothetical protein C2E21_5126 [Chlorella sorokiniana]|eukprot:PRW56311.1 hypothetical protein C2E21_5126 [Chlorella sorokiniana]
MLAGLAVAIGEAPLAAGLDPALHRLFGSLWSKIGADHQSTRQSIWSLVLGTALLGRPCLAALLASGDCLNAVVQTAGQDAALMEMLHGVLRKLQTAAACAIAAAAEAADISGSNGAEDEAAALDSVRQASANFEAAMSQRDIAVHGVRGVLLPPARRLAAALLDWWRRPAAQQEQQLEAAQATAARSCAYLRCANLGAGGGPAAGQTLCTRVPGISAETAAAAASPAQLAAWLAAVVQAVQRLGDNRQTAQWQRELLPTLVDTCHALCCLQAWTAHASAVLRPPLDRDIAECCLSLLAVLAVSLPLPQERHPAGCTWRSPFQLAALLAGSDALLRPGLVRHRVGLTCRIRG